ncbi:SusC/RagA family TonB-linked outer membrane protein [Bacteroidota bacterium]
MKKIIKSSLGVLIFMFCFQYAHAQVTVTGRITDESQENVIGASVHVKGTTLGTISDENGNYSITVPDVNRTLIFSFVGYKTREVAVENNLTIDVTLEVDISELETVVVVGYGSQRKQDITGAVAVVNTEELDKSSYTSITDRLQGRVPGVNVRTSGEPGSIGDVTIRGVSFFGDNNPLYVIDGVPTEDSPNINPADIASLQVLKDASSSAIYGSRAANGVIVITTKKGQAGKPVISINSKIGIQQFPHKMDVVNAEEFARIHNAAYDNAGYPRRTWSDDLSHGVDTDWQEEVFNDAAVIHESNVSVLTGSERSKVYFNVNSTNQEGSIYGTLFNRLGARLNTEYDLSNRIKIGQNLSVSRTRQRGQQVLDAQSVMGGDGDAVINTALMMFPTIPVYDPTRLSGYGHGSIKEAEIYLYNPVGIREMFSAYNDHTRIIGNIYANINLLEGLEYRVNFATDADIGYSKSQQRGGQITTELIHLSGMAEGFSQSSMLLFENRLTYKKEIGDHNFSIMATHTEQQYNYKRSGISINGGFEGRYPFFQISSTTAPPEDISTYGNEGASAIRSFLGRLTYSYADKYLLTANIRADGSSKFPEHNRWGTFPSVSAGWNVSKEEFFDVPFIYNLKFRGGYGEVGNASINDYAYQSLIFSRSVGGANYNLGYDDRSVIGAVRDAIVNSDLKWETLKETNIGLDLVLYDGRIELIGDYYFGKLEDLLVAAPLAGTAGEGAWATSIVNAATMNRSGWEFSARYRQMEGTFKYDISANLSHTRNIVSYLPMGDMFEEYSVTREGLPIGQIYALDYQGIYTDSTELQEYTVVNQVPEFGDAKYRDVSEDGNISEGDDRDIVGDPNPSLLYGFNFNAYWRNFEFSVFIQGVHGRDAFNAIKYAMNTSPITSYTGDYDPYIDGVGTEPRPTADFGSPNGIASSLFVEDASYLRIKNIRIGYTIPWAKVSNLSVYLDGQNLLTFTNYSGMDPEFESNILAPGVDWGGFPNVRTINTGLNIRF